MGYRIVRIRGDRKVDLRTLMALEWGRGLRSNMKGALSLSQGVAGTVGNPSQKAAFHDNIRSQVPPQWAPSSFNFETQTITSATTMAPTSNNEYLAWMILYPGSKASWLELTVKSPYKLIFPAGYAAFSTAGVVGPGRPTIYAMSWLIPGTTGIAAGSMTFGGSLQAVDFIYASGGTPGGIDLNQLEFLGEASSTDESGTSGTDTTYTFTAGKSVPQFMIALSCLEATATGISRARIQLPKVGAYARGSVPAENPLDAKFPRLWSLGKWDPSTTFLLTHKVDSLGGATNINVAGVLYYRPSP